MELSLSLEKLNFQKLRALHDVAVQNNDAQASCASRTPAQPAPAWVCSGLQPAPLQGLTPRLPQMTDYIESNLLQEQARDVKRVSASLRCAGPAGQCCSGAERWAAVHPAPGSATVRCRPPTL